MSIASTETAVNWSKNTMWWTPGRRGGGGEYPTQDGFGWTNGVMRRFIALYPEAANDPTADCGATATPADPKEK